MFSVCARAFRTEGAVDGGLSFVGQSGVADSVQRLVLGVCEGGVEFPDVEASSPV